MEKRISRGGRPEGKDFPHVKTFRFRDEDTERLAALADRWGSSEAAVIRRLLQEAAVREGIAGGSISPADMTSSAAAAAEQVAGRQGERLHPNQMPQLAGPIPPEKQGCIDPADMTRSSVPPRR